MENTSKLSIYKIDLAAVSEQLPRAGEGVDAKITSIMQLPKNSRYQEIGIDPQKYQGVFEFVIRWFISLKPPTLSGMDKALVALSGREDLSLGTKAESHLVFLYKKFKQEKTAGKTHLFVFATDQGHLAISPFVDFTFPFEFASRLCKPEYLRRSVIPLTGQNIAITNFARQPVAFRYSTLDAFCAIWKGFDGELREKTGLETLRKTAALGKVVIGEMHVRINKALEIKQHVEVCDHVVSMMESDTLDPKDPDFEYLSRIERVPPAKKELISALETLLLYRVFQAYSSGENPRFEFYHHRYVDYQASSHFSLRRRNKKTDLKSWPVQPTAAQVIAVLKREIKVEKFEAFCAAIKGFQFYYSRAQRSQRLISFFKGDVYHDGKQYFYLDAMWCCVNGEFYASVQNEFLKEMAGSFLSRSKNDPGCLPMAWVSNKAWTQFDPEVLGDMKKKVKNRTLLQELRKAPSFIGQEDGKYVVTRDPAKLPAPLKKRLGKDAVDILVHYWNRRENYREKEEGYNRNYSFRLYNQGNPFGLNSGYLMFDQIFPSKEEKIELFDVAFYDGSAIYLHHVKKQLGQHTRAACSQVRVAAGVISSAIKLGGASNILDTICDAIFKIADAKGFRADTREQIRSFGKTDEERKKNFISLFTRGEIVFVYSFLDDASKERDIEKELQRQFPLVETDFDGCCDYKKKEIPEGKVILARLVTAGYLDGNFCLTDDFIKISNENDFKIDTLKGELRKGVYRVLRSKLSQFSSFTAKKELLDTKEYLKSLGFGFRISQIYRDGMPSADLTFHGSAVDTPNELPQLEHHNLFTHDGHLYRKVATAGGGACGLHAVLGTKEADGRFVYRLEAKSDEEAHLAAKQEYVDLIRKGGVQKKLEELFEFLLTEAAKGQYESITLFKGFDLDVYSKKKEELLEGARAQKKQLALSVLENISKLKKNDKAALFKIFRSHSKKWEKLREKALLAVVKADVDNVFNANLNAISKFSVKLGLIASFKNWRKSDQEEKGYCGAFIKQNYDALLKQYANCVLDPGYYFSDREIEIIASVHGAGGVLLFTQNDAHSEPIIAHPQPYNMKSTDTPDVVILHDAAGQHYSRCEKL